MDPPSCLHFVSVPGPSDGFSIEEVTQALETRFRVGVESIQRAFGIFAISDGRRNLDAVELALVPQSHFPGVVFAKVHDAFEAGNLGRIVPDHVEAPAFTRLVAAATDELAPLKTCAAAG